MEVAAQGGRTWHQVVGTFGTRGASTSSLTPSEALNGVRGHFSVSAGRVVLPVTPCPAKSLYGRPGVGKTTALFDHQVEELNAKTGLGSHEKRGFCGVIGLCWWRCQPMVVAFTLFPPTSL